MGLDLRDGLRDLVEDPGVRPAPVPVADVAARVRRGRAARWARVGMAGVAAAAAVGLGVVTLGGAPEPVQPALPTTAPAPAPAPDTVPSSALVPMVLVDADGDRTLALVRSTGGVERELLADGNLSPGPAAATPDGAWVYVTRGSGDGQWEVLRVSTADGDVEVVGEGRVPSVSPDGTTLAYVGRTADDPERASIVVADLDGTVRRTIRDEAFDVERFIDPVAWLPDGRMLVAHGFSEGFRLGGTLSVLDERTETLQGGATFGPEGFRFGHPTVLADGDVVVAAWGEEEDSPLLRLDPVTGEVVDRIDDPTLYAGDPATGPQRYVVGLLTDPDTLDPLAVVQDWSGDGVTVRVHRWSGDGLTEVRTW